MKPQILTTIDVNTDEKISKCTIPDSFKKELDMILTEHNKTMNTFVILSQQASDIHMKWIEARKAITDTDNKFKKKMKYIAKKLNLAETDPWTYNLNEKCFELRQQPDIESYVKPEIKPITTSEMQEPDAAK